MFVVYWSHELGLVKTVLPYFTALTLALYLIFTLTNLGLMFDQRLVAIEVVILRHMSHCATLIVDLK